MCSGPSRDFLRDWEDSDRLLSVGCALRQDPPPRLPPQANGPPYSWHPRPACRNWPRCALEEAWRGRFRLARHCHAASPALCAQDSLARTGPQGPLRTVQSPWRPNSPGPTPWPTRPRRSEEALSFGRPVIGLDQGTARHRPPRRPRTSADRALGPGTALVWRISARPRRRTRERAGRARANQTLPAAPTPAGLNLLRMKPLVSVVILVQHGGLHR